MSITPFVNYDYVTLDAYAGVVTARRSDSIEKGIVVMEENEAIGILTSSDLAKKQHSIIIDCLTKKPIVGKTDKIADVLNLMDSSGQNVLMVYDKETFVGTISQNDIIYHLHSSLSIQKQTMQWAAHDLKNPIASIRMISDMLQSNLKLIENKQLVDYLNQSCDFALKIIEDVLTTEQVIEEEANYTNEDFDALIEKCITYFSKELEKKQIILSKDLNFGKSIKLDRQKFERAIHNLLSNSLKFTHENGCINIATSMHDNRLKLVVKDNGIGIPKNLQDHIFDKFTQAKRMGTGGEQTTGLGMYLTKQIVELHGGTIEMESDGESGTSFLIFLNLS
ncbi:ATP-binding protein [Flavobacterium sp. LS1R49]|uniref:histidine kinase n=1 Tax=Flavobacterium shii TaxID=2987687 RepID=A0A9X3C407_9FLAO|nr:ATP-binding protein [Flavobacterium shii]MCV9926429.1 ATP-binding protein [Flavobacterium shii]